MSELRDPYEPMATEANGLGPADMIARAREALAPVRDALERAGFYAYGTIDDENRWVISADDEAGHVDVRVGPDGYQLELWAPSRVSSAKRRTTSAGARWSASPA